MKVAVFSDIHGNAINLLRFYEVTEKLSIEKYICLGDICNYYPDCISVISLLKDSNAICLMGNHDVMYLKNNELNDYKKAAYNFNEKLCKNGLFIDYIKGLSETYQLNIQNKSILFCHASPADPLNEYVFPDSDFKKFDNEKFDIVFMGHTHRQFLKKVNGKTYCNVGSIGQPRDQGDLFGFAILDTETLEIVLYRVESNVLKIRQNYEQNTPKEVIALLDRKEKLNFNYTLIK